ncbi:MAG: hypoxanthine phosphoribosyltransferase [Armatimonadota bacterium]
MGRSPRDDIAEILVTADQLDAAVDRLAQRLTDDLHDANPLLVGVLTGSFVFLADLIRRLDFPLEVDFVCACSYREGTEAGRLVIERDLTREIAGRHVVVVDDIVDSGQTLSLLAANLRQRGPARVLTCCLLDKPERRAAAFEADYVGIKIPDRFVVGYGLDFAYQYRNLPFIGVLRQELYGSERE